MIVSELKRENNRFDLDNRSLKMVNKIWGDVIKELQAHVELLKKENQEIKDIAAALLHLPFSATEAFEKARKELLDVICKE